MAGFIELTHSGTTLLDHRGRRFKMPTGGPIDDSGNNPRYYHVHPYSSQSLWNMPMNDGMIYEALTSPASVDFRTREGIINPDHWSWDCWYDDPSYPRIQVRNRAFTLNGTTYPQGSLVYMTIGLPPDWHIPGPYDTATASTERDSWVSWITAGGRYAYDFYKTKMIFKADGKTPDYITVSRPPARTDLAGDGYVMDSVGITTTPYNASTWGMRASTLSYFAGAIRKWEVLAKQINHALEVALDNPYLKLGKVWPARSEDANAADVYTGNVPMGGRLAIPVSVNLATWRTPAGNLLTEEGLALGIALQRYGAIVGDRSGTTSLTAERPNEKHGDFASYKAALTRMSNDWKALQDIMVLVNGTTSTTPAGPGAPRPGWAMTKEGIVIPSGTTPAPLPPFALAA